MWSKLLIRKNMQTINLKEIILKKGLDVEEVAKQIFPKNKYPRLALNRVVSGAAVLDADQISKLSLLTDTPISDLYSGSNWKSSSSKGLHTFKNGCFTAVLDTNTWVTTLFHNESLFHDSVISSGSVAISQYLSDLDKIVNDFNSK